MSSLFSCDFKAYAGTKDWKEARQDFKAVLDLEPTNKTAKNQLTVAEHHLKQERDREKRLYANMFASKSADEPKVCCLDLLS